MHPPSPALAIVILAAGRGTRMRSERAKVLHTVAGRPLIVSVLDAALGLAPERIAVVVGFEADEVRRVCSAHLARRGTHVPVAFPLQREQRGTGDAVRAALPALEGFSGDVLILYGDVPGLQTATMAKLVEHHRAMGARLSLLTVTFDDPTGYGRILRSGDGRLEAIVEERDLTSAARGVREVNPGIYCIAQDLLRPALERLRADNAQREYYLTDVVGWAVNERHPVATLAVEDASEVAGINSREEMATMEERVRGALIEKWMRAGVTFHDPATTYLDSDVVIGPDSEIGPNVQLLGRTSVGRGCRFDGTALLRDATLGDRVHVRLGVVMTECRVGDDVVIGPFAHLRPATALADGVHIGNFVETKNARLGAGTKANHLTYLGDADIGDHTNVGAGTITCNYDGFAKHRTVVGSRVQIGSDTQLVAPVTVADDAYVGAGSTVTDDVPAGALVVSRVPQSTVLGWVARKRTRAAGKKAGDTTKVTVEPARGTPRAKTTASKRKTVPAPRQRARASGGRRGKR